MDVRKWLEAAGFGRFAALFEAAEIDAEALPELTDEHLKELGIPLGARVKLLKAIRGVRGAARADEVGDVHASVAQGVAPAPTLAERRRLSVMFVDLVGSTALSNRLDPEEMHGVIRAYHREVAAGVARYGGHVAQYLGDGVLAYFGYPVAHENEAERSVRAALAVLDAVAGLTFPTGEVLSARIGIATGLVVVGELFGEGAVREHAAVGETPNLAARLQGIAQPGQIVVSVRTRDLVSHLFELHSLGPLKLKGIEGSAEAYAVGTERAIRSRFEAQLTGQLGPMVGRDGELGLLMERWRDAVAGEGRLVVITGEAGIGKSRIVWALQEVVGTDRHVRLTCQCSPYHADSAMFPVIQQLSRVPGLEPGADVEARLDRLEALLAVDGAADVKDVALIAALLGIDTTHRYGPLDMTPQRQRQRTFDAIINQAIRIARHRTLLIVIEDAHWIDPTTFELLELSLERLLSSPVLIVLTARPDSQHAYDERREVSRIVLNRLGQAQIAAVVRRVAGGKSLPEGLMREIGAKTDGVPLFAEELTKTMLESGVLRETEDEYIVDESRPRPTVPASLHDSLMARLDHLQPVKEVAQTAACIGRDFDFPLLQTVMPLSEQALCMALTHLVQSELVFCRGTPPQARYSFKHALVRDAAYESLLRSTRQAIHARLAAALEAAADTPPELLALHATQAGLAEKAIDCWQKAAAHAVAKPAYEEAIAHLNQALRLAEQMGENPRWLEARLRLLLALGQASIPLHGYAHERTVAAFTRAQELSNAMADAPHRNSISYALWGAQHSRGEQDKALETARSMKNWAEKARNAGYLLTALRSLAVSQMITGAPSSAQESFEQSVRLARLVPQHTGEQRIAVAQRFAVDPEIATQFYIALTAWSLGAIARSHRLVAEALEAARKMGHAHTLGRALAHASIHAILCRNPKQALALSAETIEYASKHGLTMWKGYGLIVNAFALALTGDAAASAQMMENGFSYMQRTQTRAMVPLHHAMHARTLAVLGRFEEAARHAEAVRVELRSGSERYFWPECQRLLGDYLQLCPGTGPEEIETSYVRSLELAREQQAKSWELYSALSLAEHWFRHGARRKARGLLDPVHAGFAEGGELRAFEDASALLEQLG